MVYIVINSDGRIHTSGEKNDNVLTSGQTVLEIEGSLKDFVDSLPDEVQNCRRVNGEFISDPLPVTPIYKPSDLKEWALAQIFAPDLVPHFAAFLDFANIANQVSANQFMAYAAVINQAALAETIIEKAKELGADIQ